MPSRKSETEKQLTTAASLIGMSHGRLAVMIARERVNLADVRAIIQDLHVASLTLVDTAHALEQKVQPSLPATGPAITAKSCN